MWLEIFSTVYLKVGERYTYIVMMYDHNRMALAIIAKDNLGA